MSTTEATCGSEAPSESRCSSGPRHYGMAPVQLLQEGRGLRSSPWNHSSDDEG